jgi:nitrate/TMAO reductase-like tetraheme cytochrome c subunit
VNRLLSAANLKFGLLLAFVCVLGLLVYTSSKPAPSPEPTTESSQPRAKRRPSTPGRAQEFGRFTLWWDGIPEEVYDTNSRVETGADTNITRADYTGPEACQKCHEKNYDSWSHHPHRWMNALADESTVKGDFSADAGIDYLGGKATFTRDGDKYRMELVRGDVRREFEVTQTIGSRFTQYYVGRLLAGPEPPDHPRYTEDHVLPFGYWLDRHEWIPVVHVHDRDGVSRDYYPFDARLGPPWNDWGTYCDMAPDLYRSQCNFCHTTFPVGDMMVRDQQKVGLYVPVNLHLSMPDYVEKATPHLWDSKREPSDLSDAEFGAILRQYRTFEAPQKAVTLGVSCEACHLGCATHAADKSVKPSFFPRSPDLAIHTNDGQLDFGRTHANVNWACGRCHVGDRPEFAAGMSTWNSVEYSDAMKGSCYSRLTCIECHNPHEGIGHKWSRTAAEDDASCLKCHDKFQASEARLAHTHHPLDSEGSRCMNCHMPRLNEGLQDVVRTHMIFSPTQHQMIEANEPNACNLCHTEKPIDWTIDHLKEWYGASFNELRLARSYPDRKAPTGTGWLKSKKEFVRLVGADALTRTDSEWAMPELLDMLDDSFRTNRQFTGIGVERMLDINLSDFGYRFYMTPEERRAPLEKLREKFATEGQGSTAEVSK